MSTFSRYPAISAGSITGTVSIANGGTGATTAPAALTALNAANRSLTNLVGPVAPNVQVGMLAGTAGTPGLAFQGSLTTGFYRSAADHVGLSIAGTLAIDFFNDSFGGGAIIIPSELGGIQVGGAVTDPGVSGATISAASSFYSAGFTASTAGGNIPQYFTKAARGSLATPTAVLLNDFLGGYRFTGYNGTNYGNANGSVQMIAQATENFTSTHFGANFFIDTTPTGTNSVAPTFALGADGSLNMRRSTGANMLWITDGAGDIGPANANRPANIFASTSIHVNGNNTSALLEASSTTKGFLPPRMTTTQKNAIATPAQGLMVFDTTLVKLCVYNGTAWETITSA